MLFFKNYHVLAQRSSFAKRLAKPILGSKTEKEKEKFLQMREAEEKRLKGNEVMLDRPGPLGKIAGYPFNGTECHVVGDSLKYCKFRARRLSQLRATSSAMARRGLHLEVRHLRRNRWLDRPSYRHHTGWN